MLDCSVAKSDFPLHHSRGGTVHRNIFSSKNLLLLQRGDNSTGDHTSQSHVRLLLAFRGDHVIFSLRIQEVMVILSRKEFLRSTCIFTSLFFLFICWMQTMDNKTLRDQRAKFHEDPGCLKHRVENSYLLARNTCLEVLYEGEINSCIWDTVYIYTYMDLFVIAAGIALIHSHCFKMLNARYEIKS